jgi:tRNA threonylcarbamoyladenosine biosynthesis protein TsaB
VTVDPLILSVETATLAGSICISRARKVLGSDCGDATTSHSNTLLADIDRLLVQVDLTVRDVDVFAVASGPGSFTGLRIGLATVKALAATLNRNCLGIPTLEAIAHSAGKSEKTVALLPAGRGELFAQMFSMSVEGVVQALDEPTHLSPSRMVERYFQMDGICWTGEGARVHSNLIIEAAERGGHEIIATSSDSSSPKSWRFAEPALNLAEHVALLATMRLTTAADLSANALRAIYVRPSDAELKF